MNSKSLQQIAEITFKHIENTVRSEKPELSDQDLLSLHSIFGSTLKKGLIILDKRSLVAYHTKLKRRIIIEIEGEYGRCYKVFPKLNFCPCLAFKHQVLEKKLELTCKHIIAARIALILGKITWNEITYEQYLILLNSMFDLDEEKIMETNTVTTDYYFIATMDSTKTLSSLLKAIQFQETAILSAMPEGLKLTVEEGKCVQATAYIPSENFSEYSVKSDVDVLFKISIAVLTECLNIYGAAEEPSVKMYYRHEGSPLLLILQPQSYTNIITDCEIQTQTADTVLELRDEDEEEVAKLVLKAPAMLGLLSDVERSCDVLELVLSPDHPHLCIITVGMQDRSCIEVPKCSDMVQSFQCSRAVTLLYQLQHIRLIMKTLAISSRVVLRCSANGLLLLQLKIEKEDQKQVMYSEFYIVPLIDNI